MDNNVDEEELKKQKEQEAGQKTAHVAGKAAAGYFGGAAGMKAYDALSKTGPGQQIEQAAGNLLNRNPLMNKASQKLNESGALDAADKGLDMAGGSMGAGAPGGAPGGVSGTPNAAGMTSGGSTPTSSGSSLPPLGGDKGLSDKTGNSNLPFGDGLDSSSDKSSGGGGFGDFSIEGFPNLNKKLLLIGSLVSLFLVIIVVVVIASSTFAPLMNAYNYVKGLWDKAVDVFTKDQQELEEEFYEELKDTQDGINDVCIDVNLITASLTVYKTFDEYLEQGEESSGVAEEEEDVPYTNMIRQVKLLANMQIMNKHYDLNSSDGSYCSANTTILPVSEGKKDSSSFELIADNDFEMAVIDWFTSKTTEEENNAYYIYKPKFDSDGSCSHSYAKGKLPDDERVLSIGDYETRKDSVYYWNLVNSFIPAYYKEYLPSDEEEKQKRILEIADEIYLLYAEIGPSQSCGANYGGPSTLCPNGVTIQDGATYELEEYVAGVVSNEAYANEGMEALKAQAVAARTYVLYKTNYCTKTITNSTNDQTFTRDVNDNSRKATMQTAGEILINKDGNIFLSEYDSFCYKDEDCPDATKNEDGTYSVTYTKLPDGEKHTITLSDSKQYGRIVYPNSGHARGMSQLHSYQLAKEGYSYEEILKFYYSDEVEISLVVSPSTTEGSTIISSGIGTYLEKSNSSIEEMNNYIYSNVIKAGVGTREGVVAAANSLITGIYTQTGHILPYELYDSGKYSGYGIDSLWGTNNNGRTDYPIHGLDCSGFISWALHNGGYKYEVLNAKGWGNAGTKRSWSNGTTDDTAKPGDLIYNAPASENGTSGHIRMIIGVTTDGYVVAEASSRQNGVRIINIPFTSTGNYYLVDMTNYYNQREIVTDYPS